MIVYNVILFTETFMEGTVIQKVITFDKQEDALIVADRLKKATEDDCLSKVMMVPCFVHRIPLEVNVIEEQPVQRAIMIVER